MCMSFPRRQESRVDLTHILVFVGMTIWFNECYNETVINLIIKIYENRICYKY